MRHLAPPAGFSVARNAVANDGGPFANLFFLTVDCERPRRESGLFQQIIVRLADPLVGRQPQWRDRLDFYPAHFSLRSRLHCEEISADAKR